jgi:hypothetical protein
MRTLSLAVLLLGVVLGAARALAEPALDAELMNEALNGRKAAAVIRVAVSGVELVDPDEAGAEPVAGQAHLLYRLDGGPVVATTARKLAFRELAPGSHSVAVLLAGNDGAPLGPQETLAVLIPSAVLAR